MLTLSPSRSSLPPLHMEPRFAASAVMGAHQGALPFQALARFGDRSGARVVQGTFVRMSSNPCKHRSVAQAATAKREGRGVDETVTDDVDDGRSAREGEWPLFCDVLPGSLACEFLHLASKICDEVDSEFKLHKSKKPHRLSTTSWDILD